MQYEGYHHTNHLATQLRQDMDSESHKILSLI